MSWWRHVMAQELRKIFAFRSDFWVVFLGQIFVQIFVARALWENIFESSGNKVMEGYTLPMMTLYYLIVPISNKILMGEMAGFLSREIYDGSFNRYLIYPISFFQYKTLTYLSHSLFYGLQLIIIYLLYQGFLSDGITVKVLSDLSLGIFLMIAAAYAHCMLSMFVELIALWADNVWTLMVMLRFILYFLGGSFLPMAFLPDWLEELLMYTPFPYMISYPVKTVMGLTSAYEIFMCFMALLLWGIIFRVLAQILWNRGQHRYSGVGI